MQELSLFLIYIKKLNELNIPYIVTGSVASIIYGEPRVTHDIDIVIELNVDFVNSFMEAFPSKEFYCPPIEIIKNEVQKDNRGHCNLIHFESGFKADIYFSGKDTFQSWAINNAKKIEFNNSIIRVAPVEYVIIKKLEFYKEGKSQKHLIDIKSILYNSSDKIDLDTIKKYVIEYGLNDVWDECK